jgi:uracil-DNA glycosylase
MPQPSPSCPASNRFSSDPRRHRRLPRCRLHEQRTKIVFGVGNEQAKLVFVGEGPGADEDAQGIPFVGRAGQLLTQMIEGTARKKAFRCCARTSTSATW